MDVNHTELLLDPTRTHELYFYAYTGSRTKEAKFIVDLFRPVPAVQKHMENAKALIASGIDKRCGWVVFNPNPQNGFGTVTLPNGTCGYVASIPAKGYVTVETIKTENRIAVGKNTLENDFFKLTFDADMMLSSIYDKRAEREVLTAGHLGNELRLYADYPDNFDAWEWTEYALESYTALNQLEKAEPVQDGVRAGIRITRRHQNSTIEQTVWLYDDIDRIDFDTHVDWHERHQMLKAAFPVDIDSDRATYDIQYGSIERPTHKNTSWDAMKFEVCAHKFADLSEGDYGVTMFNDCKYGRYSRRRDDPILGAWVNLPRPRSGSRRDDLHLFDSSAYGYARPSKDVRYGV
ncbi:MAG: hypothetical protein IJW55_06770 [Clostridia bacterium]|nr:hypothetical protein [Clostridia bacterium]